MTKQQRKSPSGLQPLPPEQPLFEASVSFANVVLVVFVVIAAWLHRSKVGGYRLSRYDPWRSGRYLARRKAAAPAFRPRNSTRLVVLSHVDRKHSSQKADVVLRFHHVPLPLRSGHKPEGRALKNSLILNLFSLFRPCKIRCSKLLGQFGRSARQYRISRRITIGAERQIT